MQTGSEADRIEDHVVRLREDAPGWRKVGVARLTPEDPYLVGLDEQEADRLVRPTNNWALVRGTVADAKAHYYGTDLAPVDPGDYSVDDLRDHLDDQDYTADELDALAEAEADGKDRTTALDAIDAARGDE